MKRLIEEPLFYSDNYVLPFVCEQHQISNTDSNFVHYSDFYHYHDYIEILYVLEGTLQILSGSEQLLVKKGDILVINAKLPHCAIPCELTSYRIIKCLPTVLHSDALSVSEAKYLIPFMAQTSPCLLSSSEISHLPLIDTIKCIIMEWEEQKIGYELSIRAYILQLFTHIIRYCITNSNYFFNFQESGDAKIRAIHRILSLESSILLGMSCADAADYCNMSYSYFSRSFKQVTGTSYKHYLLKRRINEADRLLSTTDKTITEIASITGFASDAYMIQCFKEAKGITPKKYREKISHLTNY